MKYFTLIGNHDFISKENIGLGAVLTIFNEYKHNIDGVYIFASPGAYRKMSEKIKRKMISFSDNPGLEISIIDLDIANPIDFDVVYKALLDETRTVIESFNLKNEEFIINITSGTPTMSTCWVLLSKSNLIPNSKLIQSFETKFQHKYGKSCQEVDLNSDDFPEIISPDKVKRKLNRVNKELAILKDEKNIKDTDFKFPSLIGDSLPIRNIKDQILKLINNKTHVLILGEPGTGKEVIAKSIWNIHRGKKDRNQVVYDCGAIDPNLIHGELFGYVKGAFTGADRNKDGIIEKNNDKMIFLDEIGNIPRDKQNVFMRLLQSGESRKAGSPHVNTLNVQIIAATNKNIYDSNIFAPDLRDRFHEIIIIPPLRERKDDIKQLTTHFLQLANKNVSFTDDVYKKILNYTWVGNVRQLQNWVNRMCRLFSNQEVDWKEIPVNMRPHLPTDLADKLNLPDFPIDYNFYIQQLRLKAIEISNGNNSKADRLLGLKDGATRQWVFQRKNRKDNNA